MSLEDGARVIIASDGLWEVFGSEQALNFVQGVEDPREAAYRLSNTALKRRSSQGRRQDDITVLVVDLGFVPQAPQCGCTIQ